MSKFLIELPENEEIDDLVALMARFANAEFRIVQTLETNSDKLARAVAGLTGQILSPDEDTFRMGQSVNSNHQPPYAWGVDYAAGPDAGTIVEVEKKNGQVAVVKETPAAAGKFCEVCGDPVGPRRKICGKKACRSVKQKQWDAAFRAKRASAGGRSGKAEKEGTSSPVSPSSSLDIPHPSPLPTPLREAEAAGEEGPLSWPAMAEFQVMSGALKGTFLTRWEFLEKSQNGDLEGGTRLQHKDGRKARMVLDGYKTLIQFATGQSEPVLPGEGLTKNQFVNAGA